MNTSEFAAHVALDWGDSKHAFALHYATMNALEVGQIEASAEPFHGGLEQLHAKCGGRPVALAIEAGRHAVVHALLEHPWLRIYPVHPATSARFRKAFTPSGAKDDGPDAWVLLTLRLRHRDQLKLLQWDSAATRELAALVIVRRSAVDQRTQLGHQLRNVLKSYFPQALELIGCDLGSPLALDFLARWPELMEAQKARVTTLRSSYAGHHVRRPESVAQRIRHIQIARPLTTDRAVIAPAIFQGQMIVACLQTQQTHIARLEARIVEAFARHPEAAFFRQLPGAGEALAPRLLVAFGDDRGRYPNAASLQKYAGGAPVKEKSGKQTWTHWRWNAPTFLRQSFVEWPGQTVVYCDWAKAYYRRQKLAGKNHPAILRALAFKWIRILWRCWQDRTSYCEHHYIESLKRRHSPLLANLAPA